EVLDLQQVALREAVQESDLLVRQARARLLEGLGRRRRRTVRPRLDELALEVPADPAHAVEPAETLERLRAARPADGVSSDDDRLDVRAVDLRQHRLER